MGQNQPFWSVLVNQLVIQIDVCRMLKLSAKVGYFLLGLFTIIFFACTDNAHDVIAFSLGYSLDYISLHV